MRIHLLEKPLRQYQTALPGADPHEYLRDSDLNLAQRAFETDQVDEENSLSPASDCAMICTQNVFGEESKEEDLNDENDDQD